METPRDRLKGLAFVVLVLVVGGTMQLLGFGTSWSPWMMIGGPQDSTPMSSSEDLTLISPSDAARMLVLVPESNADGIARLTRYLQLHGDLNVSWTTQSGQRNGALASLAPDNTLFLTTSVWVTSDPSSGTGLSERFVTMTDAGADGVLDEIAIVSPDGNVQRIPHPADRGSLLLWAITLSGVIRNSDCCR